MSTNTNFAQNRIAKEPYWVEYLESVYNAAHSPIIDTGIPISNIGAVHCTFSHSEHLDTTNNYGFGTSEMFFFGGHTPAANKFAVTPYIGSSSSGTINLDSSNNNIYSLYSLSQQSGSSISNKIYYTNGYGLDDNTTIVVSDTHTNASLDITTTFSLFRCKDANANTALFCKIYSCHIFDNEGNVISWLRPCLHPETLKPAFYDLVRHRYLYNSDDNGEISYGHSFIPCHYITLNNGSVPEFKMLGLNFVSGEFTPTLYSISPNPNTSRLDIAVRFKQGSSKPIIQYPSQSSNSMIMNGTVSGDSVTIGIVQSNGSGIPPTPFSNNSIGKTSNIIIRNDLSVSVSYFVDNGITHTAQSNFLIDVSSGGYPIIGGTQSVMDIEGFSMRYTTPRTLVSGIQPFGFYYDFQPCRIVTAGDNYGKSAFFDYVNAQYIVSSNESVMAASENICTLTVNDTANEPTVQAVAWQYHTP